jgi:hypothetical protein
VPAMDGKAGASSGSRLFSLLVEKSIQMVLSQTTYYLILTTTYEVEQYFTQIFCKKLLVSHQ